MHRALTEYRISGFKTNISFSRFVMEHPRFISGNFDTRFIDQEYTNKPNDGIDDDIARVAAIAAAVYERERSANSTLSFPRKRESNNFSSSIQPGNDGRISNWKQVGRARVMR